MTKQRITDIDQQIVALQQRKALLLAKDKASERRAQTRQAIIVGKWLMANQPEMVNVVKARLTRPQDLHAFGLGNPLHVTGTQGERASAGRDSHD